ncbi:DUF7674 family protein [Chitinophaga caseinilytica]|uniref:DUF7674 family protein n=1 Tax=Chitinophaga caseinilytica TaxID=2267521 RepID=UPI003C2D5B37
MSTWRRKAIECLPAKRTSIASENSINVVFSILLEGVVQAHRENDAVTLRKCYDFAAWCHCQRDKALWNAADISFYRHLPSRSETRDSMPLWVAKGIYLEVRDLLLAFHGAEIIQELDKSYQK